MPDISKCSCWRSCRVCELLPVSSSAHVSLPRSSWAGSDHSGDDLPLVMLHTGTMLAVIGYFWNTWRSRFFPRCCVLVVRAQCRRRHRLHRILDWR